jgi:hypothetical protein
MLLQLKYLNPWIWVELNTDPLGAEICPIDFIELDFINKLLQANYTAPSLQEYYEKVKDTTGL